MPSRMGKQNSDINVWAAVMGDAFHPLQGNSQILIAANSNNPPTVKAGTKMFVYGTDTFTSPTSPSTLNNVYPTNTSLAYLLSNVVFELVDQTLAWGTSASATSGGTPTKANSTVYWLFCKGSQDVDSTSRGKGIYGVSTNAPTYDAVKQGWYSSDGLVIARFATDGSGNVINIQPITNGLYKTDILSFLGGQTYNGVALNVTATNGTLIRGVFSPYQKLDGSWWMKLDMCMSVTGSPTSIVVTIAGVTFKNITNYKQSISQTNFNSGAPAGANTNENASTISAFYSGAIVSFGLAGDVELDSKPTWAY